jgi:hypothetical protein
VSKRWKEIMSHPLACRSSYGHFYSTAPPLDLSNSEWRTFFAKRTKRGHAVKTGRPYSKAIYPMEGMDPGDLFDFDNMAYDRGRFAWASREGQVTVLDLRTGETASFFTENREALSEMRMSESIVAATTRTG